jgi:hypothetical protein
MIVLCNELILLSIAWRWEIWHITGMTEASRTNQLRTGPLPSVRQLARDHKMLGRAYLDDLPQYAGITDTTRLGFSVAMCGKLIARFAAIKRKCCLIAAARLPGAPEWEFKVALARWLWEDANHCRDLENRLQELRSNKHAVEEVLDYQLGDLLNEILHAPGSLPLCVGLFDVLCPALIGAIKEYLAETQPLVDFPSVRLLKRMLAEEEERLDLGRKFTEVLSRKENGEAIRADWMAHFQTFLVAAQGILGRDPLPDHFKRPMSRAVESFEPAHEFARDERFTVYVPKITPEEIKDNAVHNMMWSRCQEMPVAETMAAIIYEWDNLPADAMVDLSRHCWDEMRHATFGDVALKAEGLESFKYSNSWVGFGAHALSESPQKAYAHLAVAIEANLMGYPGGKRGEWELCRDEARHPLMTTFQDFDWADEVTHVKYGRRWLVDYFLKGNREAARKMADESIKDRVAFYAKYGVEDWMASRLKNPSE